MAAIKPTSNAAKLLYCFILRLYISFYNNARLTLKAEAVAVEV